MTPGARIQAAVELLEAVGRGEQPADWILRRWSRASRFAGGGDRRAVQSLVYGAIRRRRQLEWWVTRNGGAVTPRTTMIAVLALLENWDPARISEAFTGGGYGPAALTPDEHSLAARLCGGMLDDPEQPSDVRCNYPAWLDARLRHAFGDSLEMELAALSGEASVDLRANTLKGMRDDAIAQLAADGISAAPTPLCPLGLRLQTRAQLAASQAWRHGLVEVQDEGSQLVALLTDVEPGDTVVDFCAGGGGKALALAAAMKNRGRIVACDIAEARLRRGRTRRERAGATIIEDRVLADETDPWIAASAGTYRRVLVDAPCSGSGAWRRQPDARWRLTSDDLDALLQLQDRLLDAAAMLLAPGGRLVYATCSILLCENEERVAAFLDRTPSFGAIPVADSWARRIGGGCPADGTYLNLTPARHGTDGFFAAILERTP